MMIMDDVYTFSVSKFAEFKDKQESHSIPTERSIIISAERQPYLVIIQQIIVRSTQIYRSTYVILRLRVCLAYQL